MLLRQLYFFTCMYTLLLTRFENWCFREEGFPAVPEGCYIALRVTYSLVRREGGESGLYLDEWDGCLWLAYDLVQPADLYVFKSHIVMFQRSRDSKIELAG